MNTRSTTNPSKMHNYWLNVTDYTAPQNDQPLHKINSLYTLYIQGGR